MRVFLSHPPEVVGGIAIAPGRFFGSIPPADATASSAGAFTAPRVTYRNTGGTYPEAEWLPLAESDEVLGQATIDDVDQTSQFVTFAMLREIQPDASVLLEDAPVQVAVSQMITIVGDTSVVGEQPDGVQSRLTRDVDFDSDTAPRLTDEVPSMVETAPSPTVSPIGSDKIDLFI
jgi:hypothetical protein